MSTTTPHPVDSATRTCCGGIGTHAPDCTGDKGRIPDATFPDIPLPPGADPTLTADWDITSRLAWSPPVPLPAHLADHFDVRAVVTQYADGAVLEPVVNYGSDELSLTDARLVAAALLEAAHLADQWAGTAARNGGR